MVLTTQQLIRQMSNKDLVDTLKKIRSEKRDPAKYGEGGTSKWVTSSEFWGGNLGKLKAELKRRQKLGTVSKLAGKDTKTAVRQKLNQRKPIWEQFP